MSLNRQPSSFSNRNNNTEKDTLSPRRIQYAINELPPHNYYKKEYLNKSSHLTPTGIQFVQCNNLKNMSPSKVDCKANKLDDVNNSTPVYVPQINIKLRPALGSPNHKRTFQL